jgi:ComF family protein
MIAVPLHPKRFRKRGYNQAELLAKELSARMEVPFYKDIVRRTKNTAPLKLLNASERQNNLKKAFKIGRNDVKWKSVIIVDDIYTTGSTIDACASVLLEIGIQKIYFVALAIGRESQ